MNRTFLLITVIVSFLCVCCNNTTQPIEINNSSVNYCKNILDYTITPKDSIDKSGLMFSDQGAWLAYSFPDSSGIIRDFTGPFLMTQQNGVWSSKSIAPIRITIGDYAINQKNDTIIYQNSHASHLEQLIQLHSVNLKEQLVFLNGNSVLIKYSFTNFAENDQEISYYWENQPLLVSSLKLTSQSNEITIISTKSKAIGHLTFPQNTNISINQNSYSTNVHSIDLEPNETKEIIISQTFIFPEYSWEKERKLITNINFDSVLDARKIEKEKELKALIDNRKPQFQDKKYAEVLAKANLTLENNWRIAAGETNHDGLFPSYHYKWFNGFWSWDSWKHAVGLSYYNIKLAKNQMRAMFDFQSENGFIVDCIYRDTTIEAHNYRDTKPPLSAWAVVKIYEKDNDINFVKEMYPKLKKYHYWWYKYRDHDKDGLCEYGSTDGSLIAAKWESGMDNAIRFDDSKILKNMDGAYSLDQESIDLNAYLYAEKWYLATLAEALQKSDDALTYKAEAKRLKLKIQRQFYDNEDGWFYDTNLEGTIFIKGEGSEGWTALWANAATQAQAEAVKNKMMNPEKFYTNIPFQTMSADQPKFDPLNGYWRGPNWLDQAYFGIKGLRNYGFNHEADMVTSQILDGAEGLLGKGKSIRENYHPLTGEGLHAKNFSWSAAHIIMLLEKD